MIFHSDAAYAAIAFYVYASLTQALPEPMASERWYGFLYRFLHLLAANFKQMNLRPNGDNGRSIPLPSPLVVQPKTGPEDLKT